MKTIVVKTQKELDALPEKFEEYTTIEIRSPSDVWIKVTRAANDSSRVEAYGSSRVEAYGSSRVVAYGSSRVVAYGSSSVVAYGSSRVEAYGSSRVEAYDSSSVVAYDYSRVVAYGSSRVEAYDSSRVEAYDSSRVEANDSSRVVAYGSSRVEAYDSSRVVAYDSSSVVAYDSSRVVANGSSRVVAYGSSRVVAYDSSRVVAYDFSMLAILSAAVVIKHLADYAIASIRGVKVTIEKQDKTAKVIRTPANLEHSFEKWIERGYVYADGIRKKLIKRKKKGNLEVFTVEEFLDRKESFVVKKGDTFSHGETVEKAIEGLRYKLKDRDTSRFKKWKLDTKIKEEDAIQAYRAITGACEFGVKQFVESVKIPKALTVKKVIELTEGRFGSQQFAAFFA